MTIDIVHYRPELKEAWDAFCALSPNGTFLHSRRFLGYHRGRFKDVSAVLMESGRIIGVFPAAEAPSDCEMVVSHPGITYGGLVHGGALSGKKMMEALARLFEYYGLAGYKCLRYKAIPYIYQTRPSQDDLYALFRFGALRSRCDLSCAIDLANRAMPSERRRRGLKKALKTASVVRGISQIHALWRVLSDNLQRKHGAVPVHSLEEIELLISLFPGEIELFCAELDGRVEAGIVVFKMNMIWHTQYIAASETAYSVSALDAVFDCALTAAKVAGVRFFDFGTSNECEGTTLNEGLYQYKHEYGGGGVAHEYYDVDLLGVRHVRI